MPDTVRVRFAPSPTGSFHVGSARTALFNWAYRAHAERLLAEGRAYRCRCTPESNPWRRKASLI